jgi:tetratricopeptide (TPR) repeat protein
MKRLPEKLLCLIIVAGVSALCPLQVCSADVYQLILDGRVAEARDSLSLLVSAATRNGDVLFLESLLAPHGAESERLMRAALDASVSERFQEDIYFRLAQYYLLQNDTQKLSRILDDYMARWESGNYRGEMLRLSALAEEKEKRYEAAMRQCDSYLVAYKSREAQQKGLVDKARIMLAENKGVGSSRTLTNLSREKSGQGIPQALYLLGMDAAARNKLDDAVFYYNLLREAYPRAVGMDDLVEALGTVSAKAPSDNAAEKLTGTFYSVKVGVFSSQENAKRHAETFKQHNQPVNVVSRDISGKSYRVVYVGRFQKYDDAVRLKLQLEAAHNEDYQVVAR